MISVSEAQSRLLDLVDPLSIEPTPLVSATGRFLAREIVSPINQPPFDASAMDGYAIQRSDLLPHAALDVVGSSVAGAPFSGQVRLGEAVRIFTGAKVPTGADMVLIQENVSQDGDKITIDDAEQSEDYIRVAGQDFMRGAKIAPGVALTPSRISQVAAMGFADVPCMRPVRIVILSTGDELQTPGSPLNDGEIYGSNGYGLRAALDGPIAEIQVLPVVPDQLNALVEAFRMAMESDLIVTTGGASVGDHDLVMPAAKSLGLQAHFHKVRMRPGKPLMAGRFDDGPAFVGLPGNPVSALVCAEVFVRPIIRKMAGAQDVMPNMIKAKLSEAMPKNGPREHYMRAIFSVENGVISVAAFDRQDSALTSVLAAANCLVRRLPSAPEAPAGTLVDILPLQNI
ncbi:MAG: gephyrin-like molybdotransferase Glp [Pseudomonadota bacterium]